MVHGLNIQGRYFLHTDAWAQGNKLWPRDILPSCFEKCCRVMLFSYNDSLTVTDEDTRFVKHAEWLLRLLMERRESDPTRPLVFICHDVGGLIVKEVSAFLLFGDSTPILLFLFFYFSASISLLGEFAVVGFLLYKFSCPISLSPLHFFSRESDC